MPPKAKYTKEEIIEKAVEVIVKEGVEKLTARELAAALGTSVKPIFTAFENMEEVKSLCFDFAYAKYHSYFDNSLSDEPFKEIGKKYIEFAINDPELFKLVFLQFQNEAIPFSDYMKKLDDHYDDTLNLVQEISGLDEDGAEKLYQNMWIYSNGIATLCATKQCHFSEDEVSRMLDTAYNGILAALKE